jgi:hypothetical protein
MNRTTISLTPTDAAALRELAAALGLYLPRPLESRTGNLSALLARLAQAYQNAPDETLVVLTQIMRYSALDAGEANSTKQ